MSIVTHLGLPDSRWVECDFCHNKKFFDKCLLNPYELLFPPHFIAFLASHGWRTLHKVTDGRNPAAERKHKCPDCVRKEMHA